MRQLSIKEVQAMLLELMKEVHAFLGANNLNYYLLGGSALGAIRHNGFIPWDDDIDIGLFREDLPSASSGVIYFMGSFYCTLFHLSI